MYDNYLLLIKEKVNIPEVNPSPPAGEIYVSQWSIMTQEKLDPG